MDFTTATTEELIERRNAIGAMDLENDSSLNLDELAAEVRSINEELERRTAAEARRVEIRTAVANGAGHETDQEFNTNFEERNTTMENVEIRNSAAYINAYANYIKSGDDTECRALLTTNVAGGTVPVPDLVGDVIRTAWDREGITALVKKTYLKGNVKIGFEISGSDAVVHTEGAAAPAEETLTLGIVELKPESIKKWISVSDEALDLNGENFLRYIYDELTYRIAKKAADNIVGLIVAASTVATTGAVSVADVTAATIGLATIASAVAHLSDEATNPVIIMNKLTYADFTAVQAGANYAQDVFSGLNVKFNNSMKSYTAATTGDTYAIVGDLGNGAQLNFPNGDEVKFKYDDLSLAEKDLVKIVGREYVGMGLVACNQFCRIKK